MGSRLGPALTRLRARRSRALLAALGIFAAAAMVGTALTVSYGLATGFDRAADTADLPDLTARFAPAATDDVVDRVSGLANVESVSYRYERTDLGLETFGEHETHRSIVQVVGGDDRRGYEIVAGNDVSDEPGEVVIERGLANDWELAPGDAIYVDTLGPLTIAGVAVAPDDVAYPLASRARAWVSEDWLPPFFTEGGDLTNVVQIWARDPAQLDTLLSQARTASYGLEDLRFVTVDGVRSIVGQAAGIVIALLIAFSLVALGTAGVALGASARADVERRLQSIGVMRAIGVSRRGVASRYAADAILVALPVAALGLAAGIVVAYGPSRDLLEILNESGPGAALVLPALVCLLAIVAIVVATTIWPAWRATGRPAAETLRGAELRGRRARRTRLPAGPFTLGLRLAGARRVRTLSTALVVAAAASVVLLMLALATFLDGLQNDPGAIGKRYQLTADLPADSASEVDAIDGVAAAAPRYQVDALDSFRLGETVRLVAYPGDHTDFEAPPLAEGRRIAGPGEAEVGQGLADALGLSPGATLAVQLPSGTEARFTVVGIVRAIEVEGRIAYVRPDRLLASDPGVDEAIAVKLDDGADTAAVSSALGDLGATPEDAAGTTDRSQRFLGVLAGVLRVVAAVNGLICLYILIQALAVTAVERRQALAVLRSGGAGRGTVTLVLLGAASAVLLIAVPVAIAVQRLLLGPLVSDLAAGYASPDLAAAPLQAAAVAVALMLLAVAAARWVARRDEARPIAAALRAQ